MLPSPALFQSTPPVWVVTHTERWLTCRLQISIHTTRVGGDAISTDKLLILNSISIHTTRVGGDSTSFVLTCLFFSFQSTPPVWVVTFIFTACNATNNCISIHTTRVGGDTETERERKKYNNFNPHHPCGWWHQSSKRLLPPLLFQSTPPVWVVTICHLTWDEVAEFQSTPPVWVVTRVCSWRFRRCSISIHTTRVGGDDLNAKGWRNKKDFNPHHPCGWWPCCWSQFWKQWRISIHTTRVGGDSFAYQLPHNAFVYFNPHHPCGWWLKPVNADELDEMISIHTTRVGGDSKN